ncbi:etoposide-induced protein 2.4-domain-containing protein [Ephemerocybe angulata]|uniref:Etoposide-induced protein 2.4-domain-containing protein n=1 Tax=Ephemerocybe angulata TaxID=980116 RepID=A0A8H6MH67_9AGAR|nr:etoposide-induced protein 2.4-domain-containing protein [Tulosesus angulatus]
MSSYRPSKPESFQYSPTPRTTPRQSYPTFLSVGESLLLQAKWAWLGLYDAFRWNVVYRTIRSDPEIRGNMYKSVGLNTLSLASIYTFEMLLDPLFHDQERWLHRNIGWFYHVMWLLPVVGTSFYLNSTWVSLIAKRSFALQHGGRAAAPPPAGYTGMLKAIATSAYRVVMVFTSLLVSFGLGVIPYAGPVAAFVFFCWIDSYYCFEFVWVARGMSLSRRVRHLEERWAYYLAFGLPSTAVCMLGSGLSSAALFALIYPAYIILAMHAHPHPIDPYNPQSPSQSPSTYPPPAEDTIRHPSPFIPIRVPVFALVIWLNDTIVRILSVGGVRPPTTQQAGQSSVSSFSSSGGAGGRGRGRALSDASLAESVEMGEIGVDPGAASVGMAGVQVRGRPVRERVTLGRRKVD